MKSGKLIVIDGTDGSGKKTQSELLVRRLGQEGHRVQSIDFPRYGTNFFGSLLRECLDGKHGNFLAVPPKIASIVYAADRFESSSRISEWLQSGQHVVVDRWASANAIHQGGKIHDEAEREQFLDWLDTLEFGVFKIPRPNIIVYLHVPVEISIQLIKSRAEQRKIPRDLAESDPGHQLNAQQSALKLIERRNHWVRINCTVNSEMRSREAIHEELFLHVLKTISA